MVLRYFSGGDPFDIAEVHGVGNDEVVTSAWDVIDAIHKCREFDITFHSSMRHIVIRWNVLWVSKPNHALT